MKIFDLKYITNISNISFLIIYFGKETIKKAKKAEFDFASPAFRSRILRARPHEFLTIRVYEGDI